MAKDFRISLTWNVRHSAFGSGLLAFFLRKVRQTMSVVSRASPVWILLFLGADVGDSKMKRKEWEILCWSRRGYSVRSIVMVQAPMWTLYLSSIVSNTQLRIHWQPSCSFILFFNSLATVSSPPQPHLLVDLWMSLLLVPLGHSFNIRSSTISPCFGLFAGALLLVGLSSSAGAAPLLFPTLLGIITSATSLRVL